MFEKLQKSKQISVIALDRLGDYFELLRIELKLQGRELATHLMGYAIAGVFALLAALFIGIAIIVTFWDTQYRAIAAWAVVALYLAGAGVGIFISRKSTAAEPPFATLREELKRDVELVKENI
ncbi:phage holin family protein [Oxalobacteraceae bacterium R-40]|uniref:Phage holin family protein n=1 Tax=Keguizhuia sedimenti TaxID=3064264 RepID=A0ABU1BN76_9BURK|nr:phage holin family protein [Oxalobacteraceae bacterium R-40]